jgi:hypothetical protein
MPDIEERLSKIEAVQHFQAAMIGALAKACAENPIFTPAARDNLLRHHARLAGESNRQGQAQSV